MKRLLYTLGILTLFISLNGCQRVAFSLYNQFGRVGLDAVDIHQDSTGKKVVMVGMIHVHKDPRFFHTIRDFADSLKAEGYVLFYEGIGKGTDDSLRLDTIKRKFRRVVGLIPQYGDEGNKSVPKYARNKRLTAQNNDSLGFTTDRDFNVDMTVGQLIDSYERDKGPIILSPYDWQNGLLEKYEPPKTDDTTTYSRHYMINTLREKHLVDAIVQSEHDKIVVVYGAGHLVSLSLLLREHGFKETHNMYEYKALRSKRWKNDKYIIDPAARRR